MHGTDRKEKGGATCLDGSKAQTVIGLVSSHPMHIIDLTNVDAHLDQGWQVGAVKGIEVDGVHFGGAVATVQLVAKVQTDLGDDKVARDGEGTEKVVDSIVPNLGDGHL